MKIFGFTSNESSNLIDHGAAVEALGRQYPMAWLDLDGKVLEANDAYQRVLGYQHADLVGQNHRILVEPVTANSPEYLGFWEKLRAGEVVSNRSKFTSKGGEDVWLEASYCPIRNDEGLVTQVVKLAVDYTQRQIRSSDLRSKIEALSRSQAVIEFDLDGKILTANDVFLKTIGYTLREIQGKHHSMFVGREYAKSSEYAQFWRELADGKYQAVEVERFGKNGRSVWLSATYNPTIDPHGKAIKVVKYATDITPRRRALAEVAKNLERLAEGDLNAKISNTIDAEYAKLRDAFNDTTARLRQMVGEIQSASSKIVDETKAISDGSSELASRAESQAASLEETAATMEEMTASIKANADNAADANGNASEASKRAERGGVIVADAISAMEKIEGSSNKISDIISVIEAIAFQTNLLALNAAVEAARAGDAGKGFAVVASEVRTLAQRSSEAAKDITGLIQESTGHVTKGAELVRQTGTALEEISGAVTSVVSNIADIAAAGQEQSSGVQEVTSTVTNMDQATQQNSALAEQSAANARRLSEEAMGLSELVSHFRLTDRETAADNDWRSYERSTAALTRAPAPNPAAASKPAEVAKPAPRPDPMPAMKAASGGSWEEF